MEWLDRLNEIKKGSGKTTDEISHLSGIPKGTLNKLFAGQTKDPQLSTIKSVVHCLGYTLDDLTEINDNGRYNFYIESNEERDYIAKYRVISKNNLIGKEIIDYIVEKEYARCTAAEQELHEKRAEYKVAQPEVELSHLEPIAAHNDNASEEQQTLMQQDIDDL